MAEFQWWLLIVGLLAGGGLVAVVTMDGRRREEDVAGLERRAETTWIADRLSGRARDVDPGTVDSVLRLHREYLALPPPDRLIVAGEDQGMDVEGERAARPLDDRFADASDVDPDQVADEVGDDGRGGPDQDLARAGVQQAPPGEEAHAGADGEQRAD
jgi:hypothetical protein